MFTGFTPEAVDFLWGIRMNNNREWFLEHKKQYVEKLYEPMKALGAELFQPFLERPGNVLKVSRIYRDARMHPAEPYKESLWICIRQEVDWWAENPCLFFEITPDGVSYGFFLWAPKTASMENFRNRIAAKPDEFLEMLQSVQKDVGMDVTAVTYKRPPKPAPSEELAPYFAWKREIGCIVHEDFGDEVFSPDLAARVRDFLTRLIPVYEFFQTVM